MQNNIVQPGSPPVINYLLAVRPMFFSATILPVLLGTSIGVHISGNFNIPVFILAVLSVMFANAGINVLNDVYDDINGTDRINQQHISPFTGGSRIIQDNILTLDQMRLWGQLLLVLSALLGVMLLLIKGYMIVVFGIFGLFLGVAYSAPPLKLASRGVGELALAVGAGVLPVIGAVWLQTGQLGWEAFLISIPVSLWVANILLVNEVPDYIADGDAAKNTLVVRFGLTFTAALYLLLNVIALAILIVAVSQSYLNVWALSLCFLLFIPTIFVARAIVKWEINPKMLEQTIKITPTIHAVNCLWLLSWYIVGH